MSRLLKNTSLQWLIVMVVLVGAVCGAAMLRSNPQQPPAPSTNTPNKDADDPAPIGKLTFGAPATNTKTDVNTKTMIPRASKKEEWVKLTAGADSNHRNRQFHVRYYEQTSEKTTTIAVLPSPVLLKAEVVLDEQVGNFVVVRLLNLMKTAHTAEAFRASLTANFGKPVEILTPVGDQICVSLRTSNGDLVGKPQTFCWANGQPPQELRFALPAEVKSLTDLRLRTSQSLECEFRDVDLKAQAGLSQTAAKSLNSIVQPEPDGKEPVLFVITSGSTTNRTILEDFVLSHIGLAVFGRAGTEANVALLKALVAELCNGLRNTENWRATVQAQDFLVIALNDHIQVRDTWACFSEISDMKEDEWQQYINRQQGTSKNVAEQKGISTAGGFSYGPMGGYGSLALSHGTSEGTASYSVNQLDVAGKTALRKVLRGVMPSAAMSVKQFKQLVSRTQATWDIQFGSFSYGETIVFADESLLSPRSFDTLAELLQREKDLQGQLDSKRNAYRTATDKHLAATMVDMAWRKNQIDNELRQSIAAQLWLTSTAAHVGATEHYQRLWGQGIYDKFPENFRGAEPLTNHHLDGREQPNGPTRRELQDKKQKEVAEHEKQIAEHHKVYEQLRGAISAPSAEMKALMVEIDGLEKELRNLRTELLLFMH